MKPKKAKNMRGVPHSIITIQGKAFTFHGVFTSKLLAVKRQREIPGSFIELKDGRYYVLKPKKIRNSPGSDLFLFQTWIQKRAAKDLDRKSDPYQWLSRVTQLHADGLLDPKLEKEFQKWKKSLAVPGTRARGTAPARNHARTKANLIYKDITRIEGTKGADSLYPGEKFYHNFKRPYPSMYGLPDGSLLIRGKK